MLNDSLPNLPKSRYAFRVLTIASVSIEPLYSAFIWGAISDAITEALHMFGISEISGNASIAIKIVAIPFAAANLISDISAVDPLRAGDELAIMLSGNDNSSTKREKLKVILGTILKGLAMLTIFPVGAASDAIPVAELADAIQNIILKDVINYSVLGIITILGIVYYSMFTNARIQTHADKFIEIIKNPKKFVSDFIKHPAKYIEVAIQCLCVTAYRSIAFMFTAGGALNSVFKVAKESLLSKTMQLIVMSTNIPVTLFFRTLSIHDQYLLPELDCISQTAYQQAKGLSKAFIPEVLVSLLRGGALAGLCIKLTPTLSWGRYLLGISAGLLSSAHSLWVRYKTARQKNALQIQQTTISFTTTTLTTQDIQQSNDISQIKKIFDELQEKITLGNTEIGIHIINIMARSARFISFFGFIQTVNATFNLNMSPVAMIMLTFLCGAEIFKADSAMFGAAIRDFFKALKLKILANESIDAHTALPHLEEARPLLLSSPRILTQEKVSFSQKTKNFFRALFTSPYNYASSRWSLVKQSIEEEAAATAPSPSL